MSYLVLARKYRPQRFSELVGQEHVARTLSNAIAQNRVHHAFLFTGARGVGKTSAARILAKALSCEKGPTAEPCGDVRAVPGDRRRPFGRRHRDRRRVEHQGRGDQVDPRGGAVPARARPAQGLHHRRGPHAVGASFNALLKTLEEPPPHVVFIFATTEVHKIPVTILSRCQRFDFKLISTARLAEHLDGILQGREDRRRRRTRSA